MSLGHTPPNPQMSGGSIVVNVFDATRKPFADGPVLLTVRDGNQNQIFREYYRSSKVAFTELPVFHNFGDNYAVIASTSGFRDTGFYPVKIGAGQTQIVDLMLVPDSSNFNFFRAQWNALNTEHPALKALFA